MLTGAPALREKKRDPAAESLLEFRSKLRSLDSNQGPSGYEPDELPLLHSAIWIIPGTFLCRPVTVWGWGTVLSPGEWR